MALGFILEVDDTVAKVLTPEGNVIEVPASALSGAKPGQDIDLGDEAPAKTPEPEANTPAPAPEAAPTKAAPTGEKARQQYALQKIVSMGWSPIQAAGVVGRFMQEAYSRLDTGAIGDAGASLGVGQWNGARRRNLIKFAKTGEFLGKKYHEGGKDPYNLDTQLEFWDTEIRNSPDERLAFKTLQAAQNTDDAAASTMHYERPRGYTRANPSRGHGYDNTVKNTLAVLGDYDPEHPVLALAAGDTSPETMAGTETASDTELADLGLDQAIDPPEVASKEGGGSSEDGGGTFTPPDLSSLMNMDLGLDEAIAQGQQRIAELILSGQREQEPITSTFGDFFGRY